MEVNFLKQNSFYKAVDNGYVKTVMVLEKYDLFGFSLLVFHNLQVNAIQHRTAPNFVASGSFLCNSDVLKMRF